MAPDLECTWWPDGWPTWLGGSGDEWLQCCVAHDLGATDYELFQCVAQTGWTIMGFVMLVGLAIFEPVYREIKGK